MFVSRGLQSRRFLPVLLAASLGLCPFACGGSTSSGETGSDGGDATDDAGSSTGTEDATEGDTDADLPDVVSDVDDSGDTTTEDATPPEDGDATSDDSAEDVEDDAEPPEDAGNDADAEDTTTGDIDEADVPVPGDTTPSPDGEDPESFPTQEYCDNLSAGPFTLEDVPGAIASEDIAFDADGNLIGSNQQAIFKTAMGSSASVWVPDFKFRAGMRYLPSGDLIVCDDKKGEMVRVEPDGTRYTVLYGLSYPNGVTVDMEGLVYFTDEDQGKVFVFDPYTEHNEKDLLTAEISTPNGISFSPDYQRLYIGSFCGGSKAVYAMDRNSDGSWDEAFKWAKNVGSGCLDGIAVDVCGNIFIVDYAKTIVYRIPPDGKGKTKVIEGNDFGNNVYLPNMQWGYGIGGWSTTTLYFPNGWANEVFSSEVGVLPPPRPYPPIDYEALYSSQM